jgi:hypothetical protein
MILNNIKSSVSIVETNEERKRVITPLNEDVWVDLRADLFLYDGKQLLFVLQAENINIQLVKCDKFNYWVRVASLERVFINQPLESKMNPYFSAEHRSFIWLYTDGNICFETSVIIKAS